MCGGGGPCPVARGGTCDCVMSALAIAVVILIFRATGVLDNIFYSLGYAKATYVSVSVTPPQEYAPSMGTVTECSRPTTIDGNMTANDNSTELINSTDSQLYFDTTIEEAVDTDTMANIVAVTVSSTSSSVTSSSVITDAISNTPSLTSPSVITQTSTLSTDTSLAPTLSLLTTPSRSGRRHFPGTEDYDAWTTMAYITL